MGLIKIIIVQMVLVCAISIGLGQTGQSLVIAILNFEDNSTEEKYSKLVNGLPDLLSSRLASFENLQIVERRKLSMVLQEMQLSVTGLISEESAFEIGRLLGSDFVILGNFAQAGINFRISTRVINLQTGEIRSGLYTDGTEKRFFQMVDQLADDIFNEIKSYTTASFRVKSFPSSADVYVNGSWVGRTPYTVTDLSPGSYFISLTLNSYENWGQTFDAIVGKQTEIDVTLSETFERIMGREHRQRLIDEEMRIKGERDRDEWEHQREIQKRQRTGMLVYSCIAGTLVFYGIYLVLIAPFL